MNEIDPDKEQQNILKILHRNPELRLGEIHEHLVAMEESQFKDHPEIDWNDERRIIKALNATLRENRGWITNDKGRTYQTWGLTEEGKEEVSS